MNEDQVEGKERGSLMKHGTADRKYTSTTTQQ